MQATVANAVAVSVEARICQLLTQRQRDRHGHYAAEWSPARVGRETELRALIALVRQGRRLARREQADPITAAKAYAEMGYHAAQAAYR